VNSGVKRPSATGDRPDNGKRLSSDDVAVVIVELTAWLNGERLGQLTWTKLAQASRISRQTLCRKPAIVSLYQKVKDAQRSGKPAKPPKTVDERVEVLNAELAELRRILDEYDERFERIAYWSGSKGIDLNTLIQPLPVRNRSEEHRQPGSRHRHYGGR
jgi:hypothetical protein